MAMQFNIKLMYLLCVIKYNQLEVHYVCSHLPFLLECYLTDVRIKSYLQGFLFITTLITISLYIYYRITNELILAIMWEQNNTQNLCSFKIENNKYYF